MGDLSYNRDVRQDIRTPDLSNRYMKQSNYYKIPEITPSMYKPLQILKSPFGEVTIKHVCKYKPPKLVKQKTLR